LIVTGFVSRTSALHGAGASRRRQPVTDAATFSHRRALSSPSSTVHAPPPATPPLSPTLLPAGCTRASAISLARTCCGSRRPTSTPSASACERAGSTTLERAVRMSARTAWAQTTQQDWDRRLCSDPTPGWQHRAVAACRSASQRGDPGANGSEHKQSFLAPAEAPSGTTTANHPCAWR